MSNLRLSFACGPYDRTQALRDGTLRVEGIDLTYLALQPAEIFWRMLQFHEFDVSEMSLSNYATLVASGDCPFVAIPVFPSRVFRHGYFFVNKNSDIRSPADLKGKRGGIPEYSMTAAVYMRGLLDHEYGVKPTEIQWIQGRASRLRRPLSPDIKLTYTQPDANLSDLLELGEIDFLVTADNPSAFRRGSPVIERLFPNYAEMERDYYKRTTIYPIMHTVVIRRDVYERDPWIATSLYTALCRAKDYALRLIAESGSPKVSSAWLQSLLEEEQTIFGKDWFPYGIEPNRPTLEAFVQYIHEQGLTDRQLQVEELFARATIQSIPLQEAQQI